MSFALSSREVSRIGPYAAAQPAHVSRWPRTASISSGNSSASTNAWSESTQCRHSMLARLPRAGAQCGGEPVARTRKSRHHRAHRYAHDLADFAVRQIVELAQDDHLAQLG